MNLPHLIGFLEHVADELADGTHDSIAQRAKHYARELSHEHLAAKPSEDSLRLEAIRRAGGWSK